MQKSLINRPARYWTVNGDGRVIADGHDAPRQADGDLVRDPERNALYRVYDIGQRRRWLYLGPLS